MLFIVISLIWIFIVLIAIDGDYKSKEIKKDYKHFEEVINNKEEK